MRATNSYSAHQNTSDKYHLQTQIAVGPIVKKNTKRYLFATNKTFIFVFKISNSLRKL